MKFLQQHLLIVKRASNVFNGINCLRFHRRIFRQTFKNVEAAFGLAVFTIMGNEGRLEGSEGGNSIKT